MDKKKAPAKKATAKKAAPKKATAKKATAKKAAPKKATVKKATAKKAAPKKATAKKAAPKKVVKKATVKKAAPKKVVKKATVKKAAPKKVVKKAVPKKVVKKAKPKVKRAPNPAFMKPMWPSPELAAVVGDKAMPRTEITKKIWDYIKKNGLQDAVNRRMINSDDKLKAIFGKMQVTMFEMNKLLQKHLSA